MPLTAEASPFWQTVLVAYRSQTTPSPSPSRALRGLAISYQYELLSQNSHINYHLFVENP